MRLKANVTVNEAIENINEAQLKIVDAIDLLRSTFDDKWVENLIIAPLEIVAGEEHQWMSKDANLDDLRRKVEAMTAEAEPKREAAIREPAIKAKSASTDSWQIPDDVIEIRTDGNGGYVTVTGNGNETRMDSLLSASMCREAVLRALNEGTWVLKSFDETGRIAVYVPAMLEAATDKGDIPSAVLEALADVRNRATTNMLDRKRVLFLVDVSAGSQFAAEWLEANPTRYVEALEAMAAAHPL
jgi:hypothetical protein